MNREYRTIEKSTWGAGPWMDEPDKVQWVDEATGLDCLAVRSGHSGNWCGYVGVPESHPLHGVSYSQESPLLGAMRDAIMDKPMPEKAGLGLMLGALMGDVTASPDSVFDVHGGLTYADACQPSDDESRGICHVVEEGRPDHIWWFGFDCHHCDDLAPGSAARERELGWHPIGGIYRTLDYVQAECASLARQLASVRAPVPDGA